MILEASDFIFRAPPAVSRARRVLIKPSACYPVPYPASTSRDILSVIIDGIRRVTDADIVLLEGAPGGASVYSVYQALGYNFPRVLMLDVKDCIWVEVDNPLPKPLAVPTFWVPNVILSSDYLISVAPLKVVNGNGTLSIWNLLSLLPGQKYGGDTPGDWAAFLELGMDRVVTDLYFTLPFDLGIIEAKEKLVSFDGSTDEVEDCGKVFIGDPYQVDREASEILGLRTDYLDLIKMAEVGFDI